jgi:hypothetical protein
MRCDACRHVAVVHPLVLVWIVGYDCPFPKLRTQVSNVRQEARQDRYGAAWGDDEGGVGNT